MPKSLVIFTLLIVGAIGVSGQKNLGSSLANQNGKNQSAQAVSAVNNQACAAITENPQYQAPHWYTSPEWWLSILGIPTLLFIGWQAKATASAAKAAEASVETGKDTTKRQLRAYLSVIIGQAIYQERRDEDKGGDLMFECRPLLVNSGQTPARGIQFKARSAILPSPLPKEIHLPEEPDEGSGGSILGPNQSAHMFAVVDGFRADDEVESIKNGVDTKALYVWGRVTYEDVFGEKHFTRFCQRIYWTRDNQVRGHYIPGRNDAD
jgi:hypothetical protein